MRSRAFAMVVLLFLMWSPLSHAGRMSTYIQGTVIKKTRSVWVVQTNQGTYWLQVYRHPSHTKQYSEIEAGFWVQMRDIKKFRPNLSTAAN